MITILEITYILALILGLSIFLYFLFNLQFMLNKSESFLSSLLISPFILSLILYLEFYLIPNLANIFYITLQSIIVLLLIFTQKKHLNILLKDLKSFLSKAKFISFSLTSKILIFLFAAIFLLCTVRILFWPINWDDQIYYIEQAYSIGQSRSVNDFFNWGTFNNGVIRFDYNPAIRPGLPLIYSSVSLFSNNLKTTVDFSKIMTLYFMIVSLGIIILVIKRITKKSYIEESLIALLLIFSSSQFISLTVMGFKELPILSIVLLIFVFITRKKFKPDYRNFIFVGIMTGIMSFISLDGSLITCIVILLIFFLNKNRSKKKNNPYTNQFDNFNYYKRF